ncbi:hypothetical protein AB6A40_002456 [Gnathostoma spinigerum]|uniref:Uncharacterized protein n=1 Tax=Gnathostoma spinigerum TaxID=75299 RepID=A0ABD6E8W9_9BILA
MTTTDCRLLSDSCSRGNENEGADWMGGASKIEASQSVALLASRKSAPGHDVHIAAYAGQPEFDPTTRSPSIIVMLVTTVVPQPCDCHRLVYPREEVPPPAPTVKPSATLFPAVRNVSSSLSPFVCVCLSYLIIILLASTCHAFTHSSPHIAPSPSSLLAASKRAIHQNERLDDIIRELDAKHNDPQIYAEFITQDDDESADEDDAHEWIVELRGGEKEARILARKLGLQYAGRMKAFSSAYIFKTGQIRRPRRRKVKSSRLRRKRAPRDLAAALRSNDEVIWFEHQRSRRRVKRDHLYATMFNDPLWKYQWQLHDSRNTTGDQKMDMNVIDAWNMGFTGKGVVVTILDDGVQHDHTDLIQNYDPEASYDLKDDDPDPMPTFDEFNRHGTRCAGTVAMAANNSFCGVGIAYRVSIGGVRMLDDRITDHIEAEALSFNNAHVDIYSASWGPNDDGKTVEGPGQLAQAAILNGIRHGRGGKGSIYVWASGNGGLRDDDCDCDGYTDSIYTFSVSSAAEDGSFPWYGEKCASTLTTTYSTGNDDERMIVSLFFL